MLRDFLYQLDWTSLVIFMLTTVGGVLVVWYRKQIAEWRVFWKSVLDGLRTIPTLDSNVKGIMYFVAPNGGGSLADAAKRTEEAVQMLSEQVELVVQTMLVEDDTDEYLGRFHSNARGENISVNRLYARWLGVGKLELLGWRFLNYVHPDDVHRVRAHWDACRAENRPFHMQYRLIAVSGDVFTADVTATPIPEVLPVKRWVGVIRRLHDDHSNE